MILTIIILCIDRENLTFRYNIIMKMETLSRDSQYLKVLRERDLINI